MTEGMKEDKASWEQFIRSLIERGLKGVRLVVGDRCAGLVSTVNAMLPDAGYQRCMGCARSLAQKRSGPLPGRFQSVDCMVSPSRDMSR